MKPLYQDRSWLYKQYFEDRLYVSRIAKMCGTNIVTIYRWLGKLSIPKRGVPKRSGILNPHWKGGTYISTQGYRFVMAKGHPRAINGGYIPEQIAIVEKILGRQLKKGETIHHLRKPATDNDPSNLYLFPTKKAHDDYHHLLRWGKVERITKSNLSTNG